MAEKAGNGSEIILYQTEDGRTGIEVRFEGETVWLSQGQMAELFQTTVPNINMHIRNLFSEGELEPRGTIKEFLMVRQEGRRHVRRRVAFYNLDVIISVGYRVKSHRGTQFRIWATQRVIPETTYRIPRGVPRDSRNGPPGGPMRSQAGPPADPETAPAPLPSPRPPALDRSSLSGLLCRLGLTSYDNCGEHGEGNRGCIRE